MADIQVLLKNILSKVFGKDVRQSIHDAIQQCYYDGKAGAIDLEARKILETKADRTDISTPYNFKGSTPHAELPVEGNAVNDTYYCTDMKCKYTWDGAAWHQSSLNESDYQEELTQLANANAELKTDFSEIENGFVNQKEVLEQKYTHFIEVGKNIFDKSHVISGYSINSNTGELFVSELFNTSNYIEVKKNTTYCRNLPCNIVFFNKLFKCVGGVVTSSGVFTTTEETAYIRLSVSNGYIDELQVEKGDINTPYENYKFYKNNSLPVDILTECNIGKNKFDKNKITVGKIAMSTGFVMTDDVTVTSDYIPVLSSETYSRNVDGNYAFYDDKKNFVKDTNNNSSNFIISIPNGVSFIRVSLVKEKVDIMQFEYGKKQTNYEPFGYVIDNLLYTYQAKELYQRSMTKKPFPENIIPTIAKAGNTTIYVEDKDIDGNLYGTRWDNKIVKHVNGDDSYSWSSVVDVSSFLEDGETISGYSMRITDTGRICVATNKGRVIVSNEEQTIFTEAFTFEKGYTKTQWGCDKYKQYVLFGTYVMDKENDGPASEVYLSTDYGANWERIFYMTTDEMILPTDFHIHDVAYDPFSGAIIVVNGDTVNNQIYYSYDLGSTWKKVNPDGKTKIHPTSIVCLPKGIAFGSDDLPEGIYWWERPYKVDQPEIKNDDIIEVNIFNSETTGIQTGCATKGDYLITNYGVFGVIGFIQQAGSNTGRLFVTGDGGTSWHEIFTEQNETVSGCYGSRLVEENGKVKIYANFSKDGSLKLLTVDMPFFYEV